MCNDINNVLNHIKLIKLNIERSSARQRRVQTTGRKQQHETNLDIDETGQNLRTLANDKTPGVDRVPKELALVGAGSDVSVRQLGKL
ncbi:hypothetical protein E2C01_069799 [Portunus trituberculatus]|uniref:Uncharacterized protein n=1 Tax=Portunus trituberculatus TaxID=210409 RepID=A0A5B7HVI5_PORTR|nr:hypothetical protein [Portunus trituberculatus]